MTGFFSKLLFNNNLFKVMMGVIVAAIMVSCAAPAPRLVDHHYGLNLTLNPLEIESHQVITLERIRGQGIFSSRPLVEKISTTPLQYLETRGRLWHSAPANLLHDAVIKGWNQASGGIVAVASTASRPQFKLELDLLGIGFDERGAGFIHIRAALITSGNIVLINKDYQAVGTSQSSIEGSVSSIEAATEAAINDLALDIALALINN